MRHKHAYFFAYATAHCKFENACKEEIGKLSLELKRYSLFKIKKNQQNPTQKGNFLLKHCEGHIGIEVNINTIKNDVWF